ncbi:MAG: response regulator [Novosphingobium sp.]
MTTVLVVDDHSFLRSGVEAILTAAGMKVVGSVANGASALIEIPKANPDVVLLDIRMPSGNGVEVLQKLRKSGDKRPVVVLATEIDDSELVSLVGSSADAILFKTCSEDELISTISTVASGKSVFDRALLQKSRSVTESYAPAQSNGALSPRENAIAELVSSGLRNREIGGQLGITEGSVKVHLHKIFAKLGVKTRTEMASRIQKTDG